jgi:hypothetical protein
MDEAQSQSPFPSSPSFQSLPAGAQAVEPRRNPTGVTATNRQNGNAIDNDCEANATTTIKIATYNIRDGRNSNLEAALRACEKMRIDIGVLTETRLSTHRHTRWAHGYTVFATQTTHTNQGGIALIFTNSLYFQIESPEGPTALGNDRARTSTRISNPKNLCIVL